MNREKDKEEGMQDQSSLSTGVELGSWGRASSSSLPSVETDLSKLVSKLKLEKESLSKFTEKTDKTSLDQEPIPINILNESIY